MAQAIQTPAGNAARKANRKPSTPVVVQAAPTSPLAAMAATLVAAPVAVAPAPTVAVRGGLAIANVVLTGKPYRVAAQHNMAWWATVQATAQAAGGTAGVAALVAAGVPAPFVGYVVRRGYLQAVA